MPLTTFDPGRDGFSFANNWTLNDAQRDELRQQVASSLSTALAALTPAFPGAFALLRLSPRLAEAVAGGIPDGYGLCGGMAFAARDYYERGGAAALSALYSDRPSTGSPLYVYLWRRLLDSLTLNVPTFLAWIAMLHLVPATPPFGGGPSWLLERTREQVAELKRRLARGEPTPLGLVGDTRDPFNDHQVLAYDCDTSDPDRPIIYIYDMNCPGSGQTLSLDLHGPLVAAIESCPGARGPLRGLFCETYVGATPPSV